MTTDDLNLVLGAARVELENRRGCGGAESMEDRELAGAIDRLQHVVNWLTYDRADIETALESKEDANLWHSALSKLKALLNR